MSVQIIFWNNYRESTDMFYGIYCGTEYRVQRFFGNPLQSKFEAIKRIHAKESKIDASDVSLQSIHQNLPGSDLLALPNYYMN